MSAHPGTCLRERAQMSAHPVTYLRDRAQMSAHPAPRPQLGEALGGLATWRELKRRLACRRGLGQSALRLCVSARPLNNAAHTTPRLDEPSMARATASRTSRRAAHVGDAKAVGIGAGHPAQLCVSASVGDTPDLLAPCIYQPVSTPNSKVGA